MLGILKFNDERMKHYSGVSEKGISLYKNMVKYLYDNKEYFLLEGVECEWDHDFLDVTFKKNDVRISFHLWDDEVLTYEVYDEVLEEHLGGSYFTLDMNNEENVRELEELKEVMKRFKDYDRNGEI